MNQKNKIICSLFFKLKIKSLPLFLFNGNSNKFTTSSLIKFENRNLLNLKDRGLVVGIFPDQPLVDFFDVLLRIS